MHPIKQLQQMLNKKVQKVGTVIRNEESVIFVATEKGVEVLNRSSADVTVYKKGETVKIANGQVLGKRSVATKTYVR